MALVLLVIIIVLVYYVVRNGRFTTSHRSSKSKSWAEMTVTERRSQLADEWTDLISKIKENQRRMDRGEEIFYADSPIRRLYARDLDKMFKPGFENDPHWIKTSRKLQENMERNVVLNDQPPYKL